jgi:hypothetical protein
VPVFDDIEQARRALRAYLVPERFVAGLDLPSPPLVWTINADLQVLFAFAGEANAVQVVSAAELLEWGTEDELTGIAFAQTLHEPGVRRGRIAFTEQGPVVWVLEGQSLSVATHSLWAEQIDPPPSEHGALVAVPTAHAVYAHSIRDASALDAIQYLAKIAYDMSRDAQWPLSSHVYWQRQRAYDRLEVTVEDGRFVIAPTAELRELLDSLAQ